MKRFVLFIILIYLACLYLNPFPVPKAVQALNEQGSVKILSDDGGLLRETLADGGGRKQNVNLNDVSELFTLLLINTEDKRFFYHVGIDPLSLSRAIYQWVNNKKIISGGSTITMQLVRMAYHKPRTVKSKVFEMIMAFYLEMSLSKTEILECYINALPFANELYGLNKASEVYFKKQTQNLSLSESAYLLGIIRAPGIYNPYVKHAQIITLRNKILNNFDHEKVKNALHEPVVIYPKEKLFKAPHFTDYVLHQLKKEKLNGVRIIRTTLNEPLNKEIKQIINNHLGRLEKNHVTQASVLVVENKTGHIKGYVGSKNYWDDNTQGMIDGVLQFRQPGSALKPFTYAKALELGFSPSHVLPDVSYSFDSPIGAYIPENYNKKHYGPVLMRQALASSLNVPAVFLLKEMGGDELYDLLKELKFTQLIKEPSYYGLGLTLGNLEVSLFELVRAYSLFGRLGKDCQPVFLPNKNGCASNRSIISERSAYIIRDFLSDNKARSIGFGQGGALFFDYPVMIKTGTSQNYRDNWTVAVTPKHTIGVWVGNFNGDAMQEVSGVTGAAPIAHEIVQWLYNKEPWYEWQDSLKIKKQKVCALSGKKPTKHCQNLVKEFVPENKVLELCDKHKIIKIDKRNGLLATNDCLAKDVKEQLIINLPPPYYIWQKENRPETLLPRSYSEYCPLKDNKVNKKTIKIVMPEDGSVYKIDPFRPKEVQYLSVEINGECVSCEYLYDGQKMSYDEAQKIYLALGRHKIEVVKGDKVLDEVWYFVK